MSVKENTETKNVKDKTITDLNVAATNSYYSPYEAKREEIYRKAYSELKTAERILTMAKERFKVVKELSLDDIVNYMNCTDDRSASSLNDFMYWVDSSKL